MRGEVRQSFNEFRPILGEKLCEGEPAAAAAHPNPEGMNLGK